MHTRMKQSYCHDTSTKVTSIPLSAFPAFWDHCRIEKSSIQGKLASCKTLFGSSKVSAFHRDPFRHFSGLKMRFLKGHETLGLRVSGVYRYLAAWKCDSSKVMDSLAAKYLASVEQMTELLGLKFRFLRQLKSFTSAKLTTWEFGIYAASIDLASVLRASAEDCVATDVRIFEKAIPDGQWEPRFKGTWLFEKAFSRPKSGILAVSGDSCLKGTPIPLNAFTYSGVWKCDSCRMLKSSNEG